MTQQAVVLEHVTCSLCGDTQGEVVLGGPDRVHGVPGQFTLQRCRTCGLIYQNPRPTAAAFEAIYPTDYEPHQATLLGQPHPDLVRTTALIEQLQGKMGSLLDVGCGPGRFLLAMRQRYPNWQVAGVEPDSAAVVQAHLHGLDVFHGSLQAAQPPAHSYDAITLWNVLEHLPDPVATLGTIQGLLQSNGLLYLAVPVCDSWDARLFGPYWLGWELPRHFVAFDRHSLRAMLRRSGFTIVHTACLSGIEYCFTESLRLMLQACVQSYTIRRLSIAASYTRPFRLSLRPYLWLAAAARRCTVLTVVARKTATA